MKRSEVNALIEDAKSLLHEHRITLPPFAYWSPEEWRSRGPECDEIRQCNLGWDITDFGASRFEELGLVVFTVRNGHREIDAYQDKTYCEKILVVRENQVTPMHYHVFKMEDIISRSGGNLVCEVYNRTEDDGLADTDVEVTLDGVRRRVPAGTKLVLKPGESITLTPYLYHQFWAEEGSGTAIVGEVSKTNDDATDNVFMEALGRFPEIEEDELPVHLLCTEY
ncbi:MAG: D-lyxose/D-mannose family sugar isomerase [Candidatus Latescibacteria bacterium]|nr:D-lyxose/D-mannose family sugar isomerase [Candidatus Latescibacterota bacterium]